jgi:putative hydrolase of the HAD superfamily
MKIEAILFDLDDTLYNEVDFVRSGFKGVAKYLSKKNNCSQNLVYQELISNFKRGIRKNNFNVLLEKFNGDQEDLKNLIEIYRFHMPKISLCNDSKDTLSYLKNYYKLGLITDGHIATQQHKIDALRVNSFFDCIIINDITKGVDKSAEEPFIQLIKSLNVSPNKTIFIGDNPQKDFIIPKKLGIFTIRIKRKQGIYANIPMINGTDFEITDLKKLKDIISSIEGGEL